jgi:predicted house-cleaning NTP pyrophosphatase (Maf/HAM1 superfamily)
MRPGKDLCVEVQIYRIEVLLGDFHEHNLLPFSTPQSYALLSAESKATKAANNKERLVVCHYIVWCRTTVAFHYDGS